MVVTRSLFSLCPLDALAVVIEVANHANDSMKQGVSIGQSGAGCMGPGPGLTQSVSLQDNFQKVLRIQYSLSGHREILQPGRVGASARPASSVHCARAPPYLVFIFVRRVGSL